MKLNTKTRYALRLLIDLALVYPDQSVYLKDIAEKEGISEKYLSLIVIPLRKNGLISMFKGAHSGYILAKAPSDITLFDIYTIFEGTSILDCLEDEPCQMKKKCRSLPLWIKINDSIVSTLKNTSLAEVLQDRSQSSRVIKWDGSRNDAILKLIT